MADLPKTLPRGRAFDVVGLGENSVDQLAVVERYPEPGGKVSIVRSETQGGGQVATAMVACRRLGLRARYLGKVGDDPMGAISRASLVAEDVDVTGLLEERGVKSRYAFVVIEHGTGNRTVLYEQDAGLAMRPGQLRRELVLSGSILHVDATDLAASLEAARWAKADGMPVVIDVDEERPGVLDLIALADLCIVPGELAFALAGTRDREAALRSLQRRTAGFCCITLGAEGSAALLGERFVEVPAFAVRSVDTTACGDVFHAAMIVGLVRAITAGQAPRPLELLRYASAAAALKTRALGGRPGIPRHEEVVAFLAERA